MADQVPGARRAQDDGSPIGSAQAVASLGRELERLGNGRTPTRDERRLRGIAAALVVARRSLRVLVRIEEAAGAYGQGPRAAPLTTERPEPPSVVGVHGSAQETGAESGVDLTEPVAQGKRGTAIT